MELPSFLASIQPAAMPALWVTVVVLGFYALWPRLPIRALLQRTGLGSGGLAVALSALLFTGYAGYFLWTSDFDDRVYFTGDDKGYHSMAVNMARGNGFPVWGAIGSFDSYDFKPYRERETTTTPEQQIYDFTLGGTFRGEVSFYRAPAYPFLMGVLYSVVGVAPKLVKELQLLLLVAVAALLPLLGFWLWRGRGFLAGAAAGLVPLLLYHQLAQRLMPTLALIFTVLVLVAAWLWWDRKRSPLRSAAHGVVVAGSLLMKGAFIFLPPLYGLWMLVLWRRGRLSFRPLAAFVVVVTVILVSWSAWASSRAGRFIFLTTQGEAVLLDGNNEQALGLGSWCPLWEHDPEAFYNRPDLRDRSTLGKLGAFAVAYRASLPELLYHKLGTGFEAYPLFGLMLLMVILCLLRQLLPVAGLGGRWPRRILWIVGVVLIGQYILQSQQSVLLGLPRNPTLLLGVALLLGVLRLRYGEGGLGVPAGLWLLIANFVLITLVLFGFPRFIVPIHFLFPLIYLHLLWRFFFDPS